MTVGDWFEEITPDRREVSVCLDRRLVSELDAARRELEAVADPKMLGKAPAVEELEMRVLELEDAHREKARTFVIEGLGWGRWRDLVAKHPPEADQAETFERAVQLGFMPHAVENIGLHMETFAPAALSACCVDPPLSIEKASRMLHELPAGIIIRLWDAVWEVNTAGNNDPFVAPASAGRSDGARPSAKNSKPR